MDEYTMETMKLIYKAMERTQDVHLAVADVSRATGENVEDLMAMYDNN